MRRASSVRRLARTGSFRLALGASLIMVAASLLQLGLVSWQVARFEAARIDRILSAEAVQMARDRPPVLLGYVERRWAPDLRVLPVAGVFAADGHLVAGNIEAMPASLPPDGVSHPVSIRVDGREVAVRAVARRLPGGGRLVIGRELRDLLEVRRIALRALALGFAPALLISLGGGALLGYRALLRAGDMHRTLGAIMAGGLHRRLPHGGTGDDLDLLAGSVNAMLDRIEKLVEEIRGVGDDIAHDLRTPLARVRATLERTRSRDLPPVELRAAIDRSLGELDRVFTVITALLRIAEIESKRRRAGFAPAELAAIAADAVELYEPVAEAKEVALVVRLAAPAVIECDRDLLMEAVANLVDNAIKFTPAGGHVRVEVEGRAVAVVDDGIGLQAEERLAVTKRFFRADRSRNVPGTGLGLSLVAAIADLHGARLQVESEGRGSLFRLLF